MTGFGRLAGRMQSMQHVLQCRADEQPEQPLCIIDDLTHSFGEMNANANRLAHALMADGVGTGDVVAVLSPNRVELLEAQFGIQRTGAAYSPCSTRCSPDELLYQLEHAEARAILVDQSVLPVLEAIRHRCTSLKRVIVFDADASADTTTYEAFIEGHAESFPMAADRLDQSDLALLMYTSGTTARPKGVQFSHGNLVSSALKNAAVLGWQPGERFLHYLPMYHAAGGLAPIGPAVLTGSTLVMIRRFSASRFGEQLKTNQITLTSVNSTNVRMILNHPVTSFDRDHPCRRMRLGLTLASADIRTFEERFGTRLLGCYGMTEMGGACVGDTYGHPQKVASAGRVLNGYELYIIDENGAELGPGQQGEFVVGATEKHHQTLGYYKEPERTAEVFRDGRIYSGDYGSVDEDGYVWFAERKKDMIKRSGFNVSAAEVERAICEIPGVADAAVVGVPDSIRQEAIVAYVVATNVTEQMVLDQCAETIADYKVPQHVIFIEDLPRGILGKIDKKALRDAALHSSLTTSSDDHAGSKR